MEFWGVEVKPGESLPVCPEENQLIHISQVALGEVKNVKAANCVPVRLTVDGKKFVIGTLSAERGPQITFDLVLQKEFELSHDWKDGSIYFCGYTAEEQEDEGPLGHGFSDEEEEETSDEEEELQNAKPLSAPQAPKPANAKAAAKPSDSKAAAKPKPKVTLVDPKDDSDESDDLDDDESDDLEDDSDDDMSEDEETPQKTTPEKAKASKKRPSEPEAKTPVSTKKSKTETPQKTDGKKGSVHTATPHPAKKSEKKTAETPKSSAQVCKTCSKTFTSEKGLESHSKAKHGGK